MKKILIPTDFSEHSIYALKVAATIARKTESEIYLLHLLDIPGQYGDAIKQDAEIPEIMFFIKKVQERFDEMQKADYLKDISVTVAIHFHKAYEGISQFCKKENIDLIVMGSHGTNGFREAYVGSNTEKVVRLSEIPVLVVKKDYDVFDVKNIVFASDFSKEAVNPLKKTKVFADIFDAHLHLLMINTPGNFKTTPEIDNIMTNFIKSFPLKLNNYTLHSYNDTGVEHGVLNFSDSMHADLIAISTHGRIGIIQFFIGSVSNGLVNHSERPLITFKI